MCWQCWTCGDIQLCERIIAGPFHGLGCGMCDEKCNMEYARKRDLGMTPEFPSRYYEWKEMKKKAQARVKRILKMGY